VKPRPGHLLHVGGEELGTDEDQAETGKQREERVHVANQLLDVTIAGLPPGKASRNYTGHYIAVATVPIMVPGSKPAP
jgi:hypothetical protein